MEAEDWKVEADIKVMRVKGGNYRRVNRGLRYKMRNRGGEFSKREKEKKRSIAGRSTLFQERVDLTIPHPRMTTKKNRRHHCNNRRVKCRVKECRRVWIRHCRSSYSDFSSYIDNSEKKKCQRKGEMKSGDNRICHSNY